MHLWSCGSRPSAQHQLVPAVMLQPHLLALPCQASLIYITVPHKQGYLLYQPVPAATVKPFIFALALNVIVMRVPILLKCAN